MLTIPCVLRRTNRDRLEWHTEIKTNRTSTIGSNTNIILYTITVRILLNPVIVRSFDAPPEIITKGTNETQNKGYI